MPDWYVVQESALGVPITADTAAAAVDTLPVERVQPGGAWVVIPADRVRSFQITVEQLAPPQIRRTRVDRVIPPVPGT